MTQSVVKHSLNWIGANLPPKEELVYAFPGKQAALLLRLAENCALTDQPFWTFSREAFQGSGLAKALAEPFREVRDGRGFAIVRGLPVENLPVELIKYIFWGFGTFFGKGQSQSNLGDRIGEVSDVTHIDPHARGYRNSKELTLHTDICDMIAMLAVRSAKSGGDSAVASAHAIHDLFAAERPDLLPVLYEGYFNHRRGEEAPNEAPVTPHRVPVFSVTDGALSIRYVRPYILHGLKAKGEEHPQLIEALDLLEDFAERGQIQLPFGARRGTDPQ